MCSWKGAAVQRGLEHGGRGIATVGAFARQLQGASERMGGFQATITP
jgi:hypothetical protein